MRIVSLQDVIKKLDISERTFFSMESIAYESKRSANRAWHPIYKCRNAPSQMVHHVPIMWMRSHLSLITPVYILPLKMYRNVEHLGGLLDHIFPGNHQRVKGSCSLWHSWMSRALAISLKMFYLREINQFGLWGLCRNQSKFVGSQCTSESLGSVT